MGKKTLYLVSLPERCPGLLQPALAASFTESLVLLPESACGSQLYQAFGPYVAHYRQMGGRDSGRTPVKYMTADRLTVRKLAGNAVELASILTVGSSPLWMLAAAADLTGGTQVFLHALTEELKRLNILPPEQEFASVDGLLKSLERTTGVLSRAIDIPPLDRATASECRKDAHQLGGLRENTRGLPERRKPQGHLHSDTTDRGA